MKKIVFAALALAIGATNGSTADLSAPAPSYSKVASQMMAPVSAYDWSGFYVGVNGGGGWSHKCWDMTDSVLHGPFVPAYRDGCHDATGGTVGGQLGYRWQSGSWVFGAEGQGNWARIRGENVSTFFNIAPFLNRSTVNGLGLLTGQVGFAWNNFYWYAKGGAAVTRSKYEGIIAANDLVLDGVSVTRWGAVAGTGLEYGFTPNWSLAVEYDHLFMGNGSVTLVGIGDLVGVNSRVIRVNQDIDLVTARINYRFGGPVVAKY
jgi:outer membrane immunogenic protein